MKPNGPGTGRPRRLRRSELATPASSAKMVVKAAGSGADLVFLDLEDAVAPSEKAAARVAAGRALVDLDWGRTVRAVRINALDTPWAHDDVIEVVTIAGAALDVIIVPKARAARDVWWVDVLLTQLEDKLRLDHRIGLEVLIEEAEGLANAAEIARASGRLEALILGAGDLSGSLRIRVDTNFRPVGGDFGDGFWDHARLQVLAAARAGGLDAIDAPYPAFKDPAGYARDAERAAIMGFDGKWAIHPSQVALANAAFAPTDDEIAHARRTIAAYREAEASGRGATSVDGMLVDAAHLRLADNVLERARRATDAAARDAELASSPSRSAGGELGVGPSE